MAPGSPPLIETGATPMRIFSTVLTIAPLLSSTVSMNESIDAPSVGSWMIFLSAA